MNDMECQDILDNVSPENKLTIDSPEGFEVMNYLKRKNQHGWTGNNQVMNFKTFISPIDQTEITGLQTLKEHNKRHGVEQVGHDTEKVIQQERERRNDG